MWSAPNSKSKVTSAVWGPLDEVIITGHENGELSQWDVKVNGLHLASVLPADCVVDLFTLNTV